MKAKQGWTYGLMAAGIFLLALMIIDFNGRMADLRRLNAEKADVEVRLNQQLQTQVYLQTQVAYATSDAAVAEWAYEDGKLSKPGDVPVVVVAAPGSLPQPTALPPVEQPPSTHMQNWYKLFFGPVAP